MITRRTTSLLSFGLATTACISLSISTAPLFLSENKANAETTSLCSEASNQWDPGNVNLLTVGPDQGGHDRVVYAVAYSSDGRLLASGGVDRTIHIWNIEGRSKVRSYAASHEILNLAFSPDGRFLVGGTLDGNITIWDLSSTSNNPRRVISNHAARDTSVSRTSLAFSPDGQILATSGDDQRIRFWNINDNSLITEIEENQPVYTLAFSPDGQTLASAGSRSTVNLWDWRDQDNIYSSGPHIGEIRSVAFHPTNDEVIAFSVQFLTSREQQSGQQGYAVRLLNFEDDQVENVLNGHEEDVLSLAFSSDDSCLIRSFDDHSGAVSSVVFHPSSGAFATASSDDTIRIWRLLR